MMFQTLLVHEKTHTCQVYATHSEAINKSFTQKKPTLLLFSYSAERMFNVFYAITYWSSMWTKKLCKYISSNIQCVYVITYLSSMWTRSM